VSKSDKFFVVLLMWGYNNVRIKKGDEWKAAFITNEGLFEPTVMFFGLMNSPATFQMMMNALFEEELREGWLIIYMDDMLIAMHNNPAFHEKCIHRILSKLLINDLYLKPKKCVFEQQRVEFLGVILQNGTIHMDPAKMQGIADWPRPNNVTEVQLFLGFMGFYRYFIPNYSKIAQPLLDLTKKSMMWHWDERQKQAFEHLKTLMCRQPVLTQPDYHRDFIVHTDASAYGVGTILLQEGEIPPNVKTTKPLLHPIAYYSASFIKAERNYDIYERAASHGKSPQTLATPSGGNQKPLHSSHRPRQSSLLERIPRPEPQNGQMAWLLARLLVQHPDHSRKESFSGRLPFETPPSQQRYK